MYLLFNNFHLPLKAPVDTTVDEKPFTKQDTIELLEEPDEEVEKLDLGEVKPKGKDNEEVKEKEEEDEDEEELTLENELEQELEEPTEEQLELVTPVRRADILQKYPKLFKDFPYLEKAYYREQQFTELLPTIEDAKTAVEKSNVLDKFEADLIKGNTETVLKSVKAADENSWNKIVDDYLPALSRIDTQAYHHVIGNVIKHTIISMVNEAKTSENETLQAAAHILNQFVFGTSDFKAPTRLSSNDKPEKTEDNKISERERQFTQKQFESSRDDLNSRVNSVLKSTIDANIDPKESMSPYVKKNASREAMESLTDAINKDSRFKVLLDKLWENAFKNDFRKDSVDRIKSAYLSKAKTLLPAVIKRSRNEALKGIGKRVKEEDDDSNDESITEKSVKRQSTSHSSNSDRKEEKKGPTKPMRTVDYFLQPD